MVRYAFVTFAGLAAALPLNINLGAYSPALVVGDGEISFGGAANAAAGGNANTAAGGTVVAAAAATSAPTPVPTAAESAATDPVLAEQAQQIASLQGLGKAIAPRIGDGKLGKRDLAGFNRALTFAEAALTKGPKVELGTGAEGSGVGIIVDHNTVGGGQGDGAGAAAKRDTTAATAPRRRVKVTTMFVRRGIPASLQARSEDVLAAAAAAATAVTARAPAPADASANSNSNTSPAVPVSAAARRAENALLDAVNLNVDGDVGVTMTFVEPVEEDGEAEGDQGEGEGQRVVV
ncbi:50ab53b7-0d06-40d9-93bd-c9ba025eed2c [Thermothielavioides terrestris]|uniref:50ab53b7-0d06-40d9-93bd-c9ba025eed2c n=1 Tax=Thermothielavioides terrestris TaxID=2587410 RepID=A0A3S4AN70_9PEZI|nr:50ab53b7-0d06-40d9-93bd-c9ba025eed2c [Thermothielavioides terrestris]